MVINKALSFFPANVYKFHKQFFAVGILISRQIFAIQLRFVWMHDHLGVHIVDPEIILVFRAIAQRLDQSG